ncbi:MAG: hypothetical protein DRO13_04070 [Thermoprotei archaeon]|nr:MAG: hypothetical protein DRO13_04070 [Thermoprotei archaeon]
MKKRARARAAAGLSGFFAPHIAGTLRETGAIGGGLGIDGAVKADIAVELGEKQEIVVRNVINGEELDSCIARYIVEKLFAEAGVPGGRVHIEQEIAVPIGGGYGTSGASALAIAYALSRALGLASTPDTVAEIAHEADIVCKTGLGTVVGIMQPCRGITLVAKPGGPGLALVKCIPLDQSLRAITAFYAPIPKNSILTSRIQLERVRKEGLAVLKSIEENPSPENFMEQCRSFAKKTGLITPRIERVLASLRSVEGVIGASMNMIGEAVFALVYADRVEDALAALSKTKPEWMHTWQPGSSGVVVE